MNTMHITFSIIILTIIIVLSAGGYAIWNTIQTAPEQHNEWQLIDVNSFTISLPPGWEYNRLQGMDSHVGEFVTDDVSLHFDYGWYSNSLTFEIDDNPDYRVTYETIDGYRAKIVVPRVPGEGIVGVHFENLGGGPHSTNRLTISTRDITQNQQQTVLSIFRSIKITN